MKSEHENVFLQVYWRSMKDEQRNTLTQDNDLKLQYD